MVAVVEEMGSEEILAVVEATYRRTVADGAVLFRAAYEFATIHNGDAVNAHERVLPGTERAVRLGGAGTPLVMEFAAIQFGARMQMGSVAARHYMADALDVWHRLPRIAARVEAGEVKVSYARFVAKETRHLSVEAAGRVDAEMAAVADGRLPWGRFCDRLAGRIVAADPELAAAREAEARQRRYARPGRGSEDGLKGFFVRAPIAFVVRFDATVALLAEALKALGDTDAEELRRVKAWAIMANPMQAVELLAAFAAHRAGVVDQPLPVDLPDDTPEDPDDRTDQPADDDDQTGTAEDAAAEDAPEDAADEQPDGEQTMSGSVVPFARPLPFRPTDLPGWLTRLVTAAHGGSGGPGSGGGSGGPGSGGGSGGPGSADGPGPDPDPKGTVPQGRSTDEGWSLSWHRLLPQVTCFVHVAAESLEERAGVIRWEDQGPLSLDYLRDVVAPYQPLRFTPVLDLAGQEPVDAYEIPDRHRQAVHLRTPADCFPFSSNTTRAVDIDHTEEYRHAPAGERRRPGQSRMDNYGPLGRTHHRVKTHGHWTCKQPFDGIYLWRDPSGEFYLVDHTGTRKVTDGTLPTRRSLPDVGGLDLYEPEFVLELDLA